VDDLEEMVRAAAPPVIVEGAGVAAREVASAVAKQYRPRPRRLTRRGIAIAAVGAVLIPATAAAAVLHFTAETGQYGKPGFTENDTSQYINMCAPDIAQYIATLEPKTRPLPPGVTWNELAARYIASFRSGCPPRGPGETTQVTGIKTSLLTFSTCPWENWALTAPPSTATADLQRADEVLADTQVAEHQVNPHGTSGWQRYRDQYAHASRAFLDYDYQVNCLGRNTEANPPTVSDPNQ
jgi:hypothetical protein